MTTAERFAQISGSYWAAILPRLTDFVTRSNESTTTFARAISLRSAPRRRAFVTETAFVAWVTGSIDGAEEAARDRLAAVWNQVPLNAQLGQTELSDVKLLLRQFVALESLPGLRIVEKEPLLPGCGILDSGRPDFLAEWTVGDNMGRTLGEIKAVDRRFRSPDFRQMACYLVLHYAATREILDNLWLVNPVRGKVVHVDVEGFFALVRGQSSWEAVPELMEEWSSPGLSP